MVHTLQLCLYDILEKAIVQGEKRDQQYGVEKGLITKKRAQKNFRGEETVLYLFHGDTFTTLHSLKLIDLYHPKK